MHAIDIESAPQIDITNIGGQFENVQNTTNGWPGMNGGAGYRPFEEMGNQTGSMPGMNIGTGYYEQFQNQSYTLPSPPSMGDFSNTTVPTGSGYVDRIQGQTGAINNQTAQYQGCMPTTLGGGGGNNGGGNNYGETATERGNE